MQKQWHYEALVFLLMFLKDRPMLLVMEFVEKGCLRDYLPKKKSELTQKSLLQFGREIAQVIIRHLCTAHKINI